MLRDVSVGPVGPVSNDDVDFNLLAIHLAEGEGYCIESGNPTSFRAPGFPFVLAGLYSLAGPNPTLAYILFCVLGAITCVLTYFLALEFFSDRWARSAGLLAVVFVPHLWFATTFISENVFIPCATAGVWLFIRFMRQNSYVTLAATAIALGWATLTRPIALLMLPIFLVFIFFGAAREFRTRSIVHCAIFATLFLAVLAPWIARNHRVHGRLVFIATNGGSTFYGGNNSRVLSEPKYWGYWISTTELPSRDLIDAAPDEVSHDKVEWKLGIEWVCENWMWMPLLCVLKLGRLWIWPPDFDAGFRLLRFVTWLPYWLLLSLGGISTMRRQEVEWLIVHATILATVIAAVVFWGAPRFRDANIAFLMLYCVVGMQVIHNFALRRFPTIGQLNQPTGEMG